MCKITRISRVYTMCLTRVTRENFTRFPREIHMLLLVGIGFFVTFLSLVKFHLRGPPAPPFFAYTYALIEENKKGGRKFSARFLAFSNEISTAQKIVLSSSRGQGNFRGLEASRPRTSKFVLEDFTSANSLSFSSWFICSRICRFVQSA